MRFNDIICSTELKNRLSQQLQSGRVAHAQVFEGKAGYNSLALAIAYGQYLNCTSPVDGDSCGVCAQCRMSDSLQHPDVCFIMPVGVPLGKKGKKDDFTSVDFVNQWREIINASQPRGCFSENEWYAFSGIGGEKGNTQGSIGRKEAEYIINQVRYSPIEGGFRVFIIWLPERMNNSSANALLKLFEEPSEYNVFLFISENPKQILPTITSRTQSVVISAIETDHIYEYIKSISDYNDEDLRKIASVANGNILEAVRLTKENGDNTHLERFISLTRASYAARISEILEWVEEFATLNKEQQKAFFIESIKLLRQSFMLNIGMDNLSYSYGEELDFVANFKKVINTKNISPLIEEFEKAHRELSQNGNVKITITHFALSLTSILRIKC